MLKMQIHLKSYQLKFLRKAFVVVEQKLSSTFESIRIHVQKSYKKEYTVIRSPHVHKKSREQFFLTEYHLIFSISSKNPRLFLAMLKTISFFGVQVKITMDSSSYLSMQQS